ncbi:unnamed protein product, partial [Prorocentrum cordatum]
RPSRIKFPPARLRAPAPAGAPRPLARPPEDAMEPASQGLGPPGGEPAARPRKRKIVVQRTVSAEEYQRHKARMEAAGLDPSEPAPPSLAETAAPPGPAPPARPAAGAALSFAPQSEDPAPPRGGCRGARRRSARP